LSRRLSRRRPPLGFSMPCARTRNLLDGRYIYSVVPTTPGQVALFAGCLSVNSSSALCQSLKTSSGALLEVVQRLLASCVDHAGVLVAWRHWQRCGELLQLSQVEVAVTRVGACDFHNRGVSAGLGHVDVFHRQVLLVPLHNRGAGLHKIEFPKLNKPLAVRRRRI